MEEPSPARNPGGASRSEVEAVPAAVLHALVLVAVVAGGVAVWGLSGPVGGMTNDVAETTRGVFACLPKVMLGEICTLEAPVDAVQAAEAWPESHPVRTRVGVAAGAVALMAVLVLVLLADRYAWFWLGFLGWP